MTIEMTVPATDMQTVLYRLRVLERQNNRFKVFGIALVMLFALVGAILFHLERGLVFVRQPRPSNTVEAHQFIVKDEKGAVRAILGVDQISAGLTIYDANTDPEKHMTLAYLGAIPDFGQGPQSTLDLLEGTGRQGDTMTLGTTGITFKSPVGKTSLDLGIYPAPRLSISDDQGFSATFGSEDIVRRRTGEKSSTGAASITMFDKDSKLIWRAPPRP